MRWHILTPILDQTITITCLFPYTSLNYYIDAAYAYRNAKPYLKGNVTGIIVITKADWELEYQAKVKG
jgi:hypothetical protein